LLLPVEIPSGSLDQHAKQEARRQFRLALAHAVERHSVEVIHMHGIDFHEYLPNCDLPVVISLHLPLAWYERRALSNVRQNVSLVCVSHSQARTALSGVEISRVIPNGVDLEHFHLARRKGDYVLYMGRICPEKGLHLAIDAAERVSAKLLIAGTVFDYPEHREYFETMICPRLGRDAVFIGGVGGRRKAHLLAGAKCLLIPSQARETSSLIAMEAMASGTPVIAWRSGALPEIVSDGRAGFLVSSIDEMARAIEHVSRLSSATARKEAQQKFSSGQMIACYLNLYRNLALRNSVRELQAA
jgi:glycosyltransferase involved in cell wall biosynthesis